MRQTADVKSLYLARAFSLDLQLARRSGAQETGLRRARVAWQQTRRTGAPFEPTCYFRTRKAYLAAPIEAFPMAHGALVSADQSCPKPGEDERQLRPPNRKGEVLRN